MKKIREMKWNMWYPAGILLLIVLALNHVLDVQVGALGSGDGWLVGRYLALAVAGILAAAAVGAALFNRKQPLERVFLCTALIMGALYLYVLPPLSAPDEMRHFISAYDLSNRFLGIGSDNPDGWVAVREEDWFIEDSCHAYKAYVREDGVLAVDENGDADSAKVLGQVLTEETYRLIHEKGPFGRELPRIAAYGGDGGPAGGRGNGYALSVHYPVATTPFVYLASSIGITLARILGLNSLWVLYLGRLCNLVLFTAVTYLAMRRLPFGKEVLFGVGLLPMTIHLSASFSYDAVLMAGIFYFTAVSLHLAYAAERVRACDVALLAAVMAAVGPCKIVYAVFMGLCLLIPVGKFGSRKKWMVSAACVLGAWCVVMLLVNGQAVPSYATENTNYIDWAGEAGYSLSMLIQQPIRTLSMFCNAVVWQTGFWHQTMVGGYLGSDDQMIDMPYLAVLLHTGALVVLSLRKPGENLVLTGGRRIWVWALCLACMGGLMMSMLLAWTPVSSRMVDGVQGRYFLPFLPVFLMTVKNDFAVLTRDGSREVLYLMFCTDVYVALWVFGTVSIHL